MKAKSRLRQWVAIVAFTAVVSSMGATAWADKDYKYACQDRMNADRYKVNDDSKRHGENSPQVQRDLEKMDKDRDWCRSHHAEWDHELFDEGVYRKK